MESNQVTTIDQERDICTLINVFTVEPENQQALIDILDSATEKVMRHLPGFISANIHRSADGRHVANYAQWETAQAFQNMLSNPAAQEHMNRAKEMATFQPAVYRVVSVHHA
jgi:heme-degrading monooxygenase HmoA